MFNNEILVMEDLIPVISTAIIFSWMAIVHRLLLPGYYSSYLVFKTEEDVQKTAKSTLLRVVYVVGMAMILNVFLGFSTKQICYGVGVACFLNVWPAIIQYKLLKLNSKQKVMQLTGYLLFVVVSVLMTYMAIEVFLPILQGEDGDWLTNDNKVIEWMMAIIALIIPISIETVIAKFASIVVVLDLDTFHEDLEILKYQLAIPNRIVERNKYILDEMKEYPQLQVKFE